jgi:hypothetical protein
VCIHSERRLSEPRFEAGHSGRNRPREQQCRSEPQTQNFVSWDKSSSALNFLIWDIPLTASLTRVSDARPPDADWEHNHPFLYLHHVLKSMSFRKNFKRRLRRLGDRIDEILDTTEGTQSSTSLPVAGAADSTPLSYAPRSDTHTPSVNTQLAGSLDTHQHPAHPVATTSAPSSSQAITQPLSLSDSPTMSTPAVSSKQEPIAQAGTPKYSWEGVKALRGVLRAAPVFGPIKSVVDVFEECIGIFEVRACVGPVRLVPC